ncbi:hypothetical protein PG997_014908 [Apiospora hydei]|uniref:Uncharacterized protein n=1 Tax=Apiospora hydei TaxID=1337664 RepID=A0ABR1UXN3_9PEZI
MDLPNVDALLVTANNPARTDLSGMDHARCAALHNYLLHHAWVAEGRPPAQLYESGKTFFNDNHPDGWRAQALRPRIHPSLAAFLDTALLRPVRKDWSQNNHEGVGPEGLFFWASGINAEDPEGFFNQDAADLHDEDPDSLVCLYGCNEGGESGGGVYHHQPSHHAAVFLDMWDHDYAMPVAAHPELWHPLETILSNWIELIRVRKVVAVPKPESEFLHDPLHDHLPIAGDGLWKWRPYGEGQVATCVGAWDRLCDAIQARIIPAPGGGSDSAGMERKPLLAPSVLDAAAVPSRCFARDFLTRARRPRFQCIAPGLFLPLENEREFAASQPITVLPRVSPQAVPPVCLFPAAPRASRFYYSCRDVLAEESSSSSSSSSPSPSLVVPAGVYSEFVGMNGLDCAAEGFRLLLPFPLEGGEGLVPGESEDEEDSAATGARKSDGSPVGRGMMDELFQHGFKPFGGRDGKVEGLSDPADLVNPELKARYAFSNWTQQMALCYGRAED